MYCKSLIYIVPTGLLMIKNYSFSTNIQSRWDCRESDEINLILT